MTFPGHDRHHARFLAEYADEIVAEERRARADSDDSDESLRELLDLVHELSSIRTLPPPTLRDDVRRLLAEPPRPDVPFWTAFAVATRRLFSTITAAPRVPGTVSLAVLAAAAAAFFMTPPQLSAAEILSRADRALATLVADGAVLHRRVLVTSTTSNQGDGGRTEQVIDEWLDGGNSQRLAAQGRRPDGVLLWQYAAVPTSEGPRPHLHFTSAYGEGSNSTGEEILVVRPTREELRQALADRPEPQRSFLERFFTRGYIYEPILGELRYNALLLDTRDLDTRVLAPVRLSMEETSDADGAAIYRVGIVEPTRLWFHWGRSAPIVQIASCETVLDISRDRLLTKRASVACDTANGGTVTAERLIAALEVVPRVALPANAFDLTVSRDVPVRRQTAGEELAAFSAALDRAASTSTTLPRQ